MWNYRQAKAAGAKFIVVDPMYSETAATLDAEWIPIRPATDMAFLLGVACTVEAEAGLNPAGLPLLPWASMPSICRPMLNSRRTSRTTCRAPTTTRENAGMGQRNLRCLARGHPQSGPRYGQGSQGGLPRVGCLGPRQQHRQPAPARHDRGRHGRPHGQVGPHDGFHHACDFG